jgi:hypothetical protein
LGPQPADGIDVFLQIDIGVFDIGLGILQDYVCIPSGRQVKHSLNFGLGDNTGSVGDSIARAWSIPRGRSLHRVFMRRTIS